MNICIYKKEKNVNDKPKRLKKIDRNTAKIRKKDGKKRCKESKEKRKRKRKEVEIKIEKRSETGREKGDDEGKQGEKLE